MPTTGGNTPPILSINIGSSYISFLYFQEGQDPKTAVFPYVYNKNLFGHLTTESKFYSDVIKTIAKSLKLPATGYTTLVSGFPEPPKVDLDVKLYSSVEKSLGVFNDLSCIYVGHFKFLQANSFMYACLREDSKEGPSVTLIEKMNYESNISLYPQINPIDELKRFDMDTVSRIHSAQMNNILDPKKPVVFSGYSFYKDLNRSPFLTYLLALDLIKEHGSFELKVDEQNIIPNLGLINLYDSKVFNSISNYSLMNLGTLLNSPAPTECLLETDYGTSQLIEVEKDKLFFVPLEEGSSARIVAKSSVLGMLEKNINGGKLGFIIDTRDKNNLQMFTPEYFEKNYTPWITSVREILEGLYVYPNN